jgi:hypothetical protein
MTIWKFPIHLNDCQEISVPEGSRPLKLMMQYGRPCVWMLVDPEKPKQMYLIRVYGTGHPITGDPGHYLDSLMVNGGDLVFHVFVKQA